MKVGALQVLYVRLQRLDRFLLVTRLALVHRLTFFLQRLDLSLQTIDFGIILLDKPSALDLELLDHEYHRLHVIPEPLVLLAQGLVQLEDVLALVTRQQWAVRCEERRLMVILRWARLPMAALMIVFAIIFIIVVVDMMIVLVFVDGVAAVVSIDKLRRVCQAVIVDLMDRRGLELAQPVRLGLLAIRLSGLSLLSLALLATAVDRACEHLLLRELNIGREEARVAADPDFTRQLALLDKSGVLVLNRLESLGILILEEAQERILLLLPLPFIHTFFVLELGRRPSSPQLRLIHDEVAPRHGLGRITSMGALTRASLLLPPNTHLFLVMIVA